MNPEPDGCDDPLRQSVMAGCSSIQPVAPVAFSKRRAHSYVLGVLEKVLPGIVLQHVA
jgi:hypothetical protein